MTHARTAGAWRRGRALFGLAVALTLVMMVAMAAGPRARSSVGNAGGGGPDDAPLSATLGPVWVCWDPEDPPDPDYLESIEFFLYWETFHLTNRWPGDPGDPITLSWSLIPDGVMIPQSVYDEPELGAVASNLFAALDDEFGGRDEWLSPVQQCFDRWEALTGIDFTRVTAGGNDWDDGAEFGTAGDGVNRGDIRIGGRCIDGSGGIDCVGGTSTPGNILAYSQFPDFGGDMVIDTADNFDVGGDQRRLRNLVTHELGHGIGLRHVCPINQTKLMEPIMTLLFDGPQHDEIRATHVHYGDPFEADNGVASATDLGILAAADPIELGAGDFPDPAVSFGSIHSIDADGEEDFYRFEVNGLGLLDVTVNPIGLVYDSSQHGAGGGCDSGNFIDSEATADLAFEILDSEGTNVLLTVNGQAAGGVETATDFPLPAAGQYFVRVYEADIPEESQLYGLSLGVEMEPPVAMCLPVDAFSDGACCVTVTVDDVDGGSFDPNGTGDIDTLCITAVDGVPIGCEQSVDICDDPAPLSHTVTLTITDLSGASASCDATVTVFDAAGPELACPPDVNLMEGASTDPADTGMATATDNCDPDPVVTWSDVEIDGACLADPALFTVERTWTAVDVSGNESSCLQVIAVLKVAAGLDIRPGVCPNPYNIDGDRYLPVALLGSAEFDVTQVKLDKLRLRRADCVGGNVRPYDDPPVPPPVMTDVGTPFAGPLCDCHELQGDDIPDLFMWFETGEVVDKLELDTFPHGFLVELTVTGELLDGREFVAADCVQVVVTGPTVIIIAPDPPAANR